MSDYACRDVLGPPKTEGFASGVARKIRTTEKQLSAWSYVKDCSKTTSGPTLCPLPNYMNGIGHYELNWDEALMTRPCDVFCFGIYPLLNTGCVCRPMNARNPPFPLNRFARPKAEDLRGNKGLLLNRSASLFTVSLKLLTQHLLSISS